MSTEKRLTIFYYLLVGCFFFTACASSRKTEIHPSSSGKIRGFETMREDFNPADLDDDDIRIEDAEHGVSGQPDGEDSPAIAKRDSIGNGYRVQIIQTTDPDEAKNAQTDALLRFSHDIYRVFNPPFYKVRVGDFVNWRDAEKVQGLAIQRGFRDAWVIRTKINLKKAYADLNRF